MRDSTGRRQKRARERGKHRRGGGERKRETHT
jgi:hypothetical protein